MKEKSKYASFYSNFYIFLFSIVQVKVEIRRVLEYFRLASCFNISHRIYTMKNFK
jgi:hypothetical protein